MSNSLRRLLVAGYGRMGAIRCRDIFANPRLELAGLVEINPENRQLFLSYYGNRNIPIYSSIEEGIHENKKNGCYGLTKTRISLCRVVKCELMEANDSQDRK